MTDFDGTLTPIVGRPEDAILSEEMRKYISRLVDLCLVAIVTGRALNDIKEMVGIEGIYYVGNHGFEISGPEIEWTKREAVQAKKVISDICASIEEKAGAIEGVLVENKGFTASVHYRLVKDEDVPKVKEIFRKATKPYELEGEVRTSRGKKVLKIMPNLEWNKGKAISFLLESLELVEKPFPIYLGDDVTDEDAFRVLKRRKGLGILVSSKEKLSEAKYRLDCVDEVKIFFEKLISHLGSRVDNK